MKKPKKEKKPKKVKAKKDGDGSGKKGGMLGKLALVVTMGATSFCTVFFMPRDEIVMPEHEAVESHETTGEFVEPEPIATAFLDMTSFTVSLKDRQRVLRLGVSLETPENMVEFIDPNDPQLRDAFMGYLSAIGMEQVEDAAFLVRLRSQLTRRARFVLGEGNVQNVLITDFLVR